MTGAELQAIRKALCGTDTVKFGRALGLAQNGADATIAASVRRLEAMERVPRWFEILASIYALWKQVPEKLPPWR